MEQLPKDTDTRIAIPTDRGVLSEHFGHCREFTFIDVRDSQIVYKTTMPPPAHEPGSLPLWLKQNGTSVIIAGGMGMRAQQFFMGYGIQVLTGAPSLPPEEIIEQYIAGTLQTGANICSGGGHGDGTRSCGGGGHAGGGHGGGRGQGPGAGGGGRGKGGAGRPFARGDST